MSGRRDWGRGDDWGGSVNDDPFADWRSGEREWRRGSRDMYGGRGSGGPEGRGWAPEDYGRSSAGRGGLDRDRLYARDERDWHDRERRGRERDGDERDDPRRNAPGGRERRGWDQGYGPRTPSRDPGYAARRAISGSVPGGPWEVEDSWGAEPGWREGWQPGSNYGRGDNRGRSYSDRDLGDERRRDRGSRSDRGWWDRASDEVSSWFGDEEAERRRERDRNTGGYFRGHGPRGYTRSDERIREDVSDRLTDNPVLDAREIEVSVSGGEVTLNGHVDSRFSKRLAEDLADEVSGVRHVQNNLRIRDSRGQRSSISGTSSGIAEDGRTSDTGRIGQPAGYGASATDAEAGRQNAGMAGSGETLTGAPADPAKTKG